MRQTIFTTPILRPVMMTLCRICFKITGWQLEGRPPATPRYVLIGAPHTSNWDFPLALAIAFVYRIEMHWMGKDTLFKGWRGPVMRWLGGIPINRRVNSNVVAETIAAFNGNGHLVVSITPESTRAKVDKWKTGFYYIARGANVPIALAFLDYRRKVGGFLSTFSPTGDADRDIAAIRAGYAGISGKNSDQSTIE